MSLTASQQPLFVVPEHMTHPVYYDEKDTSLEQNVIRCTTSLGSQGQFELQLKLQVAV